MTKDMVAIQIDFCITSLFGKVGAANLDYSIQSYEQGVLTLGNVSDS
jgi:hypothetical protein